MSRGQRKQSGETRRNMLRMAVALFLEKGYQKTTTAEISKAAGMSANAIFRVFPDKESILNSLVGHMIEEQFKMARHFIEEVGEYDPVFLYGAETALQLHIAEISEALRDLYVSAYSLPTTSEYIYQTVSKKLINIFGQYLPECEEKDFYEMEIATAGITRGYMAKKCDMYFTMKQKIRRFLEVTLKIYSVPPEKRSDIAERVLTLPLAEFAEKIIRETVKKAETGFAGDYDS